MLVSSIGKTLDLGIFTVNSESQTRQITRGLIKNRSWTQITTFKSIIFDASIDPKIPNIIRNSTVQISIKNEFNKFIKFINQISL